ncbi:MAG: ATP-binding protein [Candidatus Methylacidiphilales bacterium]
MIQDENRFEELQLEGTSNTIGFKKFDYSYAIYKNNALVSQSGNYPYRTINSKTTEQDQFIKFFENGFEHLQYKNDNQLTVIVSKKDETFYEPLGLFSLIFTFFTLLLILSLSIYAIVNSRFLKGYKLIRTKFYRFIKHFINRFLFIKDPDVVLIRTRIQVSIILIVFITLSITAYVTISFIQSEYNTKQNEKLSRKIRSVVNTLQGEASDFIIKNKQNETKAYLNQLADFYDTDISVYNLNGKLVASSISKVFDEGVIADLMNPNAFYHLSKLKESQFSQAENIADFSYLAAYVPIYKNENNLIGYAQLPYFSKRADLLSEISSIVVGFINLYALLFIVIGIIAYIISHNISYPLILIQKQLSTTNLGKKNEPILWNRKDEIGDLVKQYNLMIDKLAESANKLAQSEREGAWRDIARQIAHEIKNPLTPMKLSVQHLQRAWKDQHPKLEETFHKVSKTIITQIDVLNDLASEFSNYAKMPTLAFENIQLKDALQPIIDLHQNDDNIKIINQITDELLVYFDHNYLNRTFTNLIKNAAQAIPEDRKGLIDISAIIEGHQVKIHVSDNVKGISNNDADKIFTPYFSTKIYGMGLGLPMVKNMIEAAGGTISFISKENEGTVFEVILPLGELE